MKGAVLFFFVFSKYFFNLATKHFYGVISIFTVRNEVAKVMFFTGVCLSTGGCLPQCMLGYHPLPGADTPPEQTPPGADTPQSRHPSPRYGHCCGRYASYWNAFLFQTVLNIFKTFSFFF